MLKIIIAAAALALCTGGCSSKKNFVATSEARIDGVVRISSRDSMLRVLTAHIDSPEIVLECPTLPGRRVVVRGRRMETETITGHGRSEDVTADVAVAETATYEGLQERTGAADTANWLWRICFIMLIFMTAVGLLRKFL